MKWKKLGLVFEVNNANSYLVSHASNPLAIHLENDEFRVFFSGRDKENKSSVGYVDVDICNLKTIDSEEKPLLKHGNENSFYSHGISIGNLYTGLNNKNYILFYGMANS